jgi:hypothetical protein
VLPVVASPQAMELPAEICIRVTVDSTPVAVTATGVVTGVLVVVLFPSCPRPSFPQQYAFPSVDRAQVNCWPAEIWVSVTPVSAPEVVTATGVFCGVVVDPFPSSPEVSSPQQ